jgi:hypothetical protein
MPDAGFPVVIVTGVPVVTMCEETGVTSAARPRAVLLSSAARPALAHSSTGTSEPRPEPGRCARGGPVARRVPASFGPKISCRTGQAFAFAHCASRPGISLLVGAPVSAALSSLTWAEWFSTWRTR